MSSEYNMCAITPIKSLMQTQCLICFTFLIDIQHIISTNFARLTV